jgi:iron complex outermembrane receptor protein
VVVTGLTFDPRELTDRLVTGFVQDEITFVPNRLQLIGGTKLLNTNFADLEFEPNIRLLFTPSKTQSFWAAFTRAVRTPADVERDFFLSGFVGTAPGGIPFLARFNANRNFKPEKMNGYEAGYRRLLGKNLYVDLAAFYNQYSDLFSQEITGPPFLETTPPPLKDNIPAVPHLLLPAQFGNGLKGSTSGIEVAPEWKPASFWRLRGWYSFLAMHIEKSPNSIDIGTSPGIEGSSPGHQVFAQSSFDLPHKVSFDLLYRYVSALPGQGVKPYSSGDITSSWAMSDHVTLMVVGQNLLRPHHAEFGGDPKSIVEIRRGVYGKLTFTK